MKRKIDRLPDGLAQNDSLASSGLDLKTIIDLNMDLVPKTPAAIGAATGFIGAIVGAQFFGTSAIGMVINLVMVAWIMVFTVLPLRHVFSRSLFGTEAYRYMLLPISFRHMVTSKICVGAVYCSAICLLTVLLADYVLIRFFGAGGTGYGTVAEDAATAIINLHGMLSDGALATSSVVVIIGASPLAALMESFFISAMVLLAVIIRNVWDPQKSRPQTAILIAAAAVLVYLAANFLFVWAPGLFFKNDLAVPQLAIAFLLKAGAVYGLAQAAVRLLERKYSLY